MKSIFVLSVMAFCAVALFTGPADGKVAWQSLSSMEMTKEFRDITSTMDGQWTFILTAKGDILIYSSAGKLEDTIRTEGSFDSISCSAAGDKLFLSTRSEGTLRVLSLEFLKQIDAQGSPFQGPPEAPIEIIVFTDFQCPYCASLLPVLKQSLEKYPGSVKIVLKNYPLDMHRLATPAAIAALAAHKQGKFWAYHDKLFEYQKQLTEEKFIEIATELNLDLNQFKTDMKDPEMRALVSKDILDGRNADVRGTPTAFVNGRLLKDRSAKGINELIDKLLQATEAHKKE